MRGETGQLVARVEVDAVEVEEGGVDEEEQVDVARHQEGDDEQRRGSEELEGKVQISFPAANPVGSLST